MAGLLKEEKFQLPLFFKYFGFLSILSLLIPTGIQTQKYSLNLKGMEWSKMK